MGRFPTGGGRSSYLVKGIMAVLGLVVIGGSYVVGTAGRGFSDTAGDHVITIKASSDETANRDFSIPSLGGDKYIAATGATDGAADAIKESGGTTLTLGSITDGQTLQRSGSTIIGGAGSSDADTLDTLDSTQFLRSDTADIQTAGSLTFNDDIKLYFGTGQDAYIVWDQAGDARLEISGDVYIDSGSDLNLPSGHITLTSGNLDISAGNLHMASGSDIELASATDIQFSPDGTPSTAHDLAITRDGAGIMSWRGAGNTDVFELSVSGTAPAAFTHASAGGTDAIFRAQDAFATSDGDGADFQFILGQEDGAGTQGKFQVWHGAEAAGDYVETYHDATNAHLISGSGKLTLTPASGSVLETGESFVSDTANTDDLGSATIEWRALYIGEDASSGIYLGLDQDARIYYDEAGNNRVTVTGAAWHWTPAVTFQTTIKPASDQGASCGTDSLRFQYGYFGTLFGGRYVQAKTEVEAAPYSISAGSLDNGSVFTNEGATAEVHLDLPTAAAGLMYHFVVQDADGMQINANTSDTIRIDGSVSASAGNISTATIGDTVTLIAINATEWVAIQGANLGGWGFDL